MLNLILRACIQQAAHAGSLYVTTTISVIAPLNICTKTIIQVWIILT